MINPDKITAMETLRAELFASLQSEDAAEQERAFTNFAEGLQVEVMKEAKAQMDMFETAYNDEKILAARGTQKPLTSVEKKYFNEVIKREGFDNVEQVFPKTIIQDVFKNLKEEHPILSGVDMQNTEVLAQYIFARPNKAKAFWGPICEDIKQMILEGFEVVDVRSARLSGFVPVCKGMLELGPEWLANYVTTLMREIMAASLELAIVQGDGKHQPIGMMKKLSGAVDSVHPDKALVTVADFEPATLAGIRAAMAKAKTDTSNVKILVNPMTYWAKVFPNLAFKNADGTWVHDRLPTGEAIETSYAVPEDRLIIGDLKNYALGVASDVDIKRYTETLAIEDMDLFIAKFYGFGMAKDPNAFFVADVSTVTGATVAPLEEYAAPTGTEQGDSIITGTTQVPGV